MIEFKMPKLGESVTEGTIGRWLKQPGDPIEQYEPMLEVTTDKVDTEVSSPIDGVLAEILVPEGETVSVGTVIARLSEGGSSNGVASSATAESVTIAAQPAAAAVGSSRANYVSPAVARIAAEHNVDLKMITGTGGGGRITKKDVEAFVASGGAKSTPAESPTASGVAASATAPREEAQLQEALESRPTEREATGTQSPTDQPRAAQPSAPAPARPATPAPTLGPDDELVPLTGMRRAIAEHMVRSKQTAPHVTTVMEADLSRISAHRARNKADFERQGVNLTFTAYFVEAVVAALRAVPIVNATFTEQGILMHNRINVGVAVAINEGLIVPVLKDADEKSLLGLARSVNDLAERARTRRLQPDDTQGGTFTITNHGVSGSLFAMPVINQPQSGILGVGAIQKRAVVITEHGMDAIAIRPMCYLSLTFDHRLIDGATADQFLMTIKRTLEQYGD